jgi:sugar phosphate isomerase/epimerase
LTDHGKGRGVKLGLDTYSYHYAAGLWEYTPHESPPMGLDHFLQKTVDLDLDGLQLADARHLDSLEYGYISEVRRKAEALGLYVELGTAGTNPDHLQNMVRTAHVLGASIVRTFLGRPRPASPKDLERLLAAAAAEILQVMPLCERYGVSLAVENHQDLTTGELLSLLQHVDNPWLGVCFDTANPLAVMEDPLESARAFGSLVKTVHLKDFQVAARQNGFCLVGCALGEGVVDLPGIVDLLQSEAPQANLNIEAYIGKQAIPALDDGYLAGFPETPARTLGWALRLVRDRGLRREPELELERGAPEGDLLAAEDELVVRSVTWARDLLGRAGGRREAGRG